MHWQFVGYRVLLSIENENYTLNIFFPSSIKLTYFYSLYADFNLIKNMDLGDGGERTTLKLSK